MSGSDVERRGIAWLPDREASVYRLDRKIERLVAESNGPPVRVRLLRSLYFGGELLGVGSEAQMPRWDADIAASLGRVEILSAGGVTGKA